MTVPINSKASMAGDDALENALDWIRLNARAVGIGAAVIAVAAAGWWFYRDAEINKENAAGKAYMEAQRSAQAGNLPLAQADLEKMLPRYHGTTSGTLAAILLAQVHYQNGKYPDGVKVLEAAAVAAPDQLRAPLQALMAAGLVDQKKYADAAKGYLKAADMTSEENAKEGYQAEAARAWQLAGNQAEALKLWKAIAEHLDSPHAAEARVRVGELEAAQVK
ncbi:MAG: tetratricopeptide repeat protein [Gemmatimonadetes bacterium]|nr:tetratricopeptide repeat protein [Gemmatimonadota bacterium]